MARLTIDCQDFPEITAEFEALLYSRLNPVFAGLAISGDVTIKVGTEEESNHLNMIYRNKNSSTDVLSFILDDPLPDGTHYWGDIHIAYPVALRQAAENGHAVQIELLILAVHGLLHLSGLDHESDQGEMMTRQNEIVQRIIPPTDLT